MAQPQNPPAGRTLLDYFQQRKSAMNTERVSFVDHWKACAEFVRPRRGRFFIQDVNRGDRRYSSIINSRATKAHHVATSGLLAGIMSPARPWFALETPDPEMMGFPAVKIWLYKVELILRTIFNDSNLYNMAPVLLGELLLFGTGLMLHVDDFDDVARFYTQTIGSYWLAQNDKYKVDTFCREFQMTAIQMMRKFGYDQCSTSVKTALDNGNYDSWFPVVHFVEPNPDFRPNGKMSRNKRFRSVYYEPGNSGPDRNKELEYKGFDEFPGYAPRWDVTDEDVYGTDCPTMTTLGDIKGLQIKERRKARAIDLMVNPPLKGPPSLKNVNVAGIPGGLTVYDDPTGGGSSSLQPLYQLQQPPIEELVRDIDKTEKAINENFFVDLFLAITTMDGVQPRNQLELNQRNQERLLQLGPTLERLHGEIMTGLINRTFAQAIRAQILPPAPRELAGQVLKIKYISSLAMAQQAAAAGSIERVSAFVGSLVGGGFPQAADKFDADQAVDEYAGIVGVPPRLVVPDEIVQQTRQARAQAQQRAQNAALAESAAKTGNLMAKSDTSGPNVLTAASEALKQRLFPANG